MYVCVCVVVPYILPKPTGGVQAEVKVKIVKTDFSGPYPILDLFNLYSSTLPVVKYQVVTLAIMT